MKGQDRNSTSGRLKTMITIRGAALIEAAGASFHIEMLGDGSPLVLVPGAGGDAGQYLELSRALAENHTVVTYDRRNNSRSPRQPDWADTSATQQGEDLIALLDAVGIERSAVYGNSTGAVIALAAVLNAPSRFSYAILHEPALLSVLSDPDEAMATVQPVIAAGVEESGLAGGAEAFVRFAAGDAAALLPHEVMERLRDNARVLLEAEFGAFSSWKPDQRQLAELTVPLAVWSAEETAPFFVEVAEWVAAKAGVRRETVPGGHMGFLNHAPELAAAMEELLSMP